MTQNRYTKKPTFAQRHSLLINVGLSVVALGVLFSRPIYDSFAHSSQEIEDLRKEVLRDLKLAKEKLAEQAAAKKV